MISAQTRKQTQTAVSELLADRSSCTDSVHESTLIPCTVSDKEQTYAG